MQPSPRPARTADAASATDAAPDLPTDPDDPRIEVRRSTRRRRTVSARVEGRTVVVLMPAGLSRTEERRLISDMLARLERSAARRRPRGSDTDLMRRAVELSGRWLDGAPRPASVRWVPAMSTRWASCSPGSREIRISEALREVPPYVLDYVLVHELVHLVVPGGHPPRFWEEVRRFPRTERAMGYLEAYARVLRDGAGGPEAADAGTSGADGRGGESMTALLDDGDEARGD